MGEEQQSSHEGSGNWAWPSGLGEIPTVVQVESKRQGWKCVLGPEGTGLWMPCPFLFVMPREPPKRSKSCLELPKRKVSDIWEKMEEQSLKARRCFRLLHKVKKASTSFPFPLKGQTLQFSGLGAGEGRSILNYVSSLEGFSFVTFPDSHEICLSLPLTVKSP